MKLENQVCSLESAKRLVELGIKQESLFYWMKFPIQKQVYENIKWKWEVVSKDFLESAFSEKISAFTVAELGEILPKEIKIGNDIYEFSLCRNSSRNPKCEDSDYGWEFSYQKSMPYGRWIEWVYSIGGIDEVESRAKMLIYLMENKLSGYFPRQ